MTITPQSFRVDYPEFRDAGKYSDAGIQLHVAVAGMLLNQQLWGPSAPTATNPPTTIYDVGVGLFVAHNLTLEIQQIKASNNGAAPGVTTGAISSKSVNGVSQNYDTAAGIDEGASHWNLTVYGIRFIRLCKQFGAVPFIAAGNIVPNDWSTTSTPAWPGPPFFGFSN